MSDNSVPGHSQSAPEAPPAPATGPLGAFDLLLASGSQVSQEETVEDATPRPLPASEPEGLAPASGLGLQRHEHIAAPKTGVVDWGALVLSVIAPPLGILVAIAAIVLGIRHNGFAATVAKVALAIGIVLTLVLGVALYLVNDVQKKQAAHDAIVSSSVQWCTELKASPGTLSSPTYGFPSSQDTIPASIAAAQKYESFWTGLVKVAPAGIRKGTQSIATTAAGIASSASSSRVFDDDSNTSVMQQAVSNSGINDWVSAYCN